jgi:hypothetical protein
VPIVVLERDAAADHRVGANRHVLVDRRRRRIVERDAGQHRGAVLARAQDGGDLREVDARVHAAQLGRVLEAQRRHASFALAVHRDEIGEVVLALGVVRRQLVQRREQRLERERVDAAVDFPDAALVAGGVPLLDDALHLAGRVAHNAAVPVRLVDDRGQNRGGGALARVRLEQAFQGVRFEERDVGVQQQHRARLPRQHRLGLEQRVAGAELRRLQDELEAGPPRQRSPHLVLAVSDHEHGLFGVERVHGVEHVLDHRAAGDGMEDLGPVRLHPGAFPGGEDDDEQHP